MIECEYFIYEVMAILAAWHGAITMACLSIITSMNNIVYEVALGLGQAMTAHIGLEIGS